VGDRAAHEPPAGRAGVRTSAARYVFALAASLAALLGMLALRELDETPFYALLVGCVAVVVGFGGLGPGLLAAVTCWAASLVVFVGDTGVVDFGTRNDRLRWAGSFVIALGAAWVTTTLRSGRERAATAARSAEESVRDLEALQAIATSCSAALTQADVAHALIERLPRLLGARGGAVALLDGTELVIVDPQMQTGLTHLPGVRFPLTLRAPIAQAAATGRPVVVRDRAAFERLYPDGVALTDYARAAVAIPLRIAGEVEGSISFLFDDEAALREDAAALAQIAANLSGQALERARLYDREADTRQALDRILRMSPAFHGKQPETVTAAVCEEARVAFGADFGMLWRLDGGRLELEWADPPTESLAPGLVADLADFPRLLDAVGTRDISFVADVQQEAVGGGLERVRQLGVRSSLRMPVAVAGRTRHVVIVSWESVVSEPDASTILLARRFADQAGLALEQLERRRAETEATAYAEETRRLQQVTVALAMASSATDVGDTCLEHALDAVGADAGYVVLVRPGDTPLEMISVLGYEEDELEAWSALDLEADLPVSRAFASGEPVWALTASEMEAFTGRPRHPDRGWAALPLRTPAGVRGVLHLSFRTERVLSDGERQWLQAVVSQCAQALERSLLFDEEQRLRERSERLQQMTADLSNALTRADVAEVVAAGVMATVDADGTTIGIVQEDRQLLRTLAWKGYPEEVVERWLETPLDDEMPGVHAVRRGEPRFYGSFEELHEKFPALSREGAGGHDSFFFVPLVAGGRANGLLAASWAEARTLSADERRFILSLAGQAGQALDRASHFESEQTIAATLQRSVLPVSLPRLEGVQLAARYLPGTADLNVGGDWFDAIPLQDGRLGLVVGDVVGKGVQAAATMAQLRNGLRAFSLDRMKPASTIGRLDRLADEVLDAAFATMVYAVVDPHGLVCRYTSAGHPPALVIHPDGRVELLEGGRGLPLGTGTGAKYSQAVLELETGSVLLLYTDGLVERRGASIDDGLERLRQAALEAPREPELLLEHILERMVGAAEREDDIALLAARVFTVAPQPLEVRVPGDLGALNLIRDTLRVWLEGVPAARAESEEIVLAVWEACANAIEHAHDPASEVVKLTAAVDDSTVRVVVEDTGGWKPPTETPGRGLGLRLIRSLMSSVDVATGDDGTRVTLEKALAGAGEPQPGASRR
jgi:serine phosphatase RsbU (regulator of sigma subunit)/anti-sigma regulatory factor (Ser/Thr protein kinase)/transcriptional regulator with GAF, ATPase, and Fis domain